MFSGRQVLLLEDEVYLGKMLLKYLEEKGADVFFAKSIAEASSLLDSFQPEIALIDVNLPDGNSLELLRLGKLKPTLGTVVMTAEGGVEVAVEAMRLGALDYLSKPFEPEELGLVFKRLESNAGQKRIRDFEGAEWKKSGSFFIGERLKVLNEQIDRIIEADQRLSQHLPPILLYGETGTGKSTLARWIHERGSRKEGPFVAINCSALPETLVESELFGHEKGAFTDARATKIGLFEAAAGGTLFLDEISSLPLKTQAKLLLVIEEQLIRRVGGNRSIKIDTRVIGATIEPLSHLVSEGKFREDLYHRLDLLSLELPPIRNHPKDLPELANYLVVHLARKYRLKNLQLSDDSMSAIRQYSWPGNIRELMHELERAIIFREGDQLRFGNLSNRTDRNQDESSFWSTDVAIPDGFRLEDEIKRLTEQMIEKALRQTDQNVSAAARLLGVSRDFIRYRKSD